MKLSPESSRNDTSDCLQAGHRQTTHQIVVVAGMVGITALLALVSCMARMEETTKSPSIVRLDPRLDRVVTTDAQLEIIAGGFAWVEGPVWDPAGHYLLFSDIPTNTVYRWKATEGTSVFLHPSGYSGSSAFEGREPGSNGLALDRDGRLVLCEHGDRRITRLEPDRTKTVLADHYEGKRLNSPNDLVFSSFGDLYFTDPPFGLPLAFDDSRKELSFQGVYRLGRDGTLTLLISELKAPNGLAFSPDETILYVSDVDFERAAWHAYPVNQDGTVGPGRIFADAGQWKRPPFYGPDGMKVDRAGNLFGARPGGVSIFAPDGTHLGDIETGFPTSNLAWGEDGSTLFITGGSAVYRLRTLTAGAGWEREATHG